MVDAGLRERKKQATRAALGRAAWRLTIERGYDNVRVEDIAAAAGVSVRTFSNYFANKGQALVSVGEDRGQRIVAALRARPPGEDLWEALAAATADQFTGGGEVPRDYASLVAYPAELAAAHRRLSVSIEAALTIAIAERTGTDAKRDLYPPLVSAMTVSATQAAFDYWRRADAERGADAPPGEPFDNFLRRVLRQVAAGLPARLPDAGEGEMNEPDTDVVIVGAGPVGLTLAAELRLYGVRALVMERLAEPTGLSKALGLIGRSVDTLDRRGLLGRFQARGAVVSPSLLHFSMIPLDAAKVDGLGLRGVFIQQAVTEEILTGIAVERGVPILRGHEVVALDQDDEGVSLHVSGPDGDRQLRARYVVGCDGGSSVVRKQAGIGFPGIPPTFLLRLGDVTLADGLTPQDIPGLRVPLVPLGGGYYRVIVTEPYPDGLDRDAPMPLDELRASIRRVNGADVPVSGARWLSRFTDSSRLADSYRAGRVLLAGDAAHIHLPAGGPGLNTGLLDAFNLGWKLAAQVQGWASPQLLDTYSAERRAEGERVLLHTRAQGALLGFASKERVTALREVLRQLLQFSEPVRHLVSLMYALDTRYDTGCPHPLAGGWRPDLALTADAERAAELGRGILVDLTGDGLIARLGNGGLGNGWKDRVDYATATATATATAAGPLPPADGAPVAALLVRPDGYVAWAATPDDLDADGLRHALSTWFGS